MNHLKKGKTNKLLVKQNVRIGKIEKSGEYFEFQSAFYRDFHDSVSFHASSKYSSEKMHCAGKI